MIIYINLVYELEQNPKIFFRITSHKKSLIIRDSENKIMNSGTPKFLLSFYRSKQKYKIIENKKVPSKIKEIVKWFYTNKIFD